MLLFERDVPELEWAQFRARGFERQVCGTVYRDRTSPAVCGVPLGGIDTGCIDLETSGLWGYSCIFDSHVPRSGPLNSPILGLSVDGRTWVLTTGRTKEYEADTSAVDRPEPDYAALAIEGCQLARDILYWGHFPVADLEYELDGPVEVAVRAWSPFLPGHVGDSLTPGIVFEVHLHNATDRAVQIALACSIDGPTEVEGGALERLAPVESEHLAGLTARGAGADYTLGAIQDGEHTPRSGGALGSDGTAWSRIATELPASATPGSATWGASVVADRQLESGAHAVLRFVFAWRTPHWRAGGNPGATDTTAFSHMYAARWPSSLAAAQHLAGHHDELLARILAWQSVIYTEDDLPVWLRQSLVNILHLITEDGMWATHDSPGLEWTKPEDGLFGMNECPRGCPQIECSPCTWYGSIPLVYFFPELALSTLRNNIEYQDEEGCPTWIFGGVTMDTAACEMTEPSRGYQVPQNVSNYVDMVHRYWLRTGDPDFLREFYPSIKRTMLFTAGMNTGPDGIVSFPDHRVSVPHEDHPLAVPVWETVAFEWMEWRGLAALLAGMRLAQLRMVEQMARLADDPEFAEQCSAWFAEGSRALEEKLWAGHYYLNFIDPATGHKMDAIFAYQLDGQWMTDSHGLAPAFREDRIGTVLQTLAASSIGHSKYGAVNFCNPDGTPMEPGQEFIHNNQMATDYFTPESVILGATYLYRGDRDTGLSLVQKTIEAVEHIERRTWDQPNIINGMNGRARFGSDYCQNLILWCLPAAIAGQDLGGPCRPGGLVDRVSRAVSWTASAGRRGRGRNDWRPGSGAVRGGAGRPRW